MRSELNALWARVRALQRRFARELAEYRLEPLCDDLCERLPPAGCPPARA